MQNQQQGPKRPSGSPFKPFPKKNQGGQRQGGGGGGKKFHKPNRPYIPPLTPEEKAMVNVLDDQAQDFLTRVNRAENALPNREQDYKTEIMNKTLTIILRNGKEITGELADIDKYKIMLRIDDTVHYYYKQALMGYFVNEKVSESIRADSTEG